MLFSRFPDGNFACQRVTVQKSIVVVHRNANFGVAVAVADGNVSCNLCALCGIYVGKTRYHALESGRMRDFDGKYTAVGIHLGNGARADGIYATFGSERKYSAVGNDNFGVGKITRNRGKLELGICGLLSCFLGE